VPNDASQIVELLQSDGSAVRYWAAMGLLIRGRAGVEAGRDELLSALGDESPIVRIAAAEAMGRFGNDDDAKAALDALTDYVGPDTNYFLSVAAWNSLDFLDDRAAPALPLLKSVVAERDNVPPRMGEYIGRLKYKTLRDLEGVLE
jgi:uncharacterized sulfatase